MAATAISLPIARPISAARRQSGLRQAVLEVMRDRLALAATIVLLVLVLLAILAPIIQLHEPLMVDLRSRQAPPSLVHPLGTDHLGRDVWARLVWGARTSLPVGLVVVTIALVIGGTLGTLSGFYGRKVDLVVVPIVNALLTIPGLLLAIAMVAAFGGGLFQVMLAIGIGQLPRFVRLQRSVVIGLRERDYVLAARAIGAGSRRILWRHVVPNSIAPMIVLASLASAAAIVVEASLSFLGLGIPPPTPSWGSMLADGRNVLRTAPWVGIFPGLMIMLVALALNVIGDTVRDVTDPRLRGSRSSRNR